MTAQTHSVEFQAGEVRAPESLRGASVDDGLPVLPAQRIKHLPEGRLVRQFAANQMPEQKAIAELGYGGVAAFPGGQR